MKKIKAAAIQIAPDLSGGAGTVERVCDAVGRAAAQGVKLAVFPETFIPYYPYFSFVSPPVATGKEHLRLYENAVTGTRADHATTSGHGGATSDGIGSRGK